MDLSKVVLKARILNGCDSTNEVGTKDCELQACPEKH